MSLRSVNGNSATRGSSFKTSRTSQDPNQTVQEQFPASPDQFARWTTWYRWKFMVIRAYCQPYLLQSLQLTVGIDFFKLSMVKVPVLSDALLNQEFRQPLVIYEQSNMFGKVAPLKDRTMLQWQGDLLESQQISGAKATATIKPLMDVHFHERIHQPLVITAITIIK